MGKLEDILVPLGWEVLMETLYTIKVVDITLTG